MALLKSNTTAPVQCEVTFTYSRLTEWPFHNRKVSCALYLSHLGRHKAYIDGVGWYAWLRSVSEGEG